MRETASAHTIHPVDALLAHWQAGDDECANGKVQELTESVHEAKQRSLNIISTWQQIDSAIERAM